MNLDLGKMPNRIDWACFFVCGLIFYFGDLSLSESVRPIQNEPKIVLFSKERTLSSEEVPSTNKSQKEIEPPKKTFVKEAVTNNVPKKIEAAAPDSGPVEESVIEETVIEGASKFEGVPSMVPPPETRASAPSLPTMQAMDEDKPPKPNAQDYAMSDMADVPDITMGEVRAQKIEAATTSGMIIPSSDPRYPPYIPKYSFVPNGNVFLMGILVDHKGNVIDVRIAVPSAYPNTDLAHMIAAGNTKFPNLTPPLKEGEVRWIEDPIFYTPDGTRVLMRR